MKKRKLPLMKILQPGERSEHWEAILLMRDNNDPRWKTFSSGMQASALAYEANRNKTRQKTA
jgi:hypothetical protein